MREDIPGHPIHGTVGGRPATMSVLLEDGEAEIFAPPFFRMDEWGAFQLADMLVKYFLPEQEAKSQIHEQKSHD